MSKFPEFAEWGRQGGVARAKRLTKKRRQEIARKAGSTKKKKNGRNGS